MLLAKEHGMERQTKVLPIKSETYTLQFERFADAYECQVFKAGQEIVHRVRKAASEHEVKFLGHVMAYNLAGLRRDQECDAECERGWELISLV
jgi:hypothetical protein